MYRTRPSRFGWRSSSRAEQSWRGLPENSGLTNEQTKMGMDDFKREAEQAMTQIGMRHRQCTWCEQGRQPQFQKSKPEEIVRAAKDQRFCLDEHAQRHA